MANSKDKPIRVKVVRRLHRPDGYARYWTNGGSEGIPTPDPLEVEAVEEQIHAALAGTPWQWGLPTGRPKD